MTYGHFAPPTGATQLGLERAAATRTLTWGSIIGLVGVLCVAVGVGMMVAPSKDSDVGSGAFCFVIALLIMIAPGAAMLAIGMRGRRRIDRLQTVAALGATNARLGIQMLCATLGTNAESTMKLVLEAVNLGLLRGRMDMGEGVFISAMVNQEIREFHGRCPSCGAVVTVQIPPGGTGACPYCRQPIR